LTATPFALTMARMKTLLVASLLLAAAPAFAQSSADESTLRALINAGKRLAPQAQAVLEQQQSQIDSKCKLTKLEPDTVSVMTDVTFNLDGIPERGEWTTSYLAQACNKPVRRTVGFKGTAKGVEVFAGAPGETKADAQLGQDVWRGFKIAATRAQPACKKMTLLSTQIAEEPAGPMGNWREAWIADVCGRQMGQIVSFYPTKRGTMFRLSLPEKTQTSTAQ
jgi:hypothetical protein